MKMKKILLLIMLVLNAKICLGSDKPKVSKEIMTLYKKALELIGEKRHAAAVKKLEKIKLSKDNKDKYDQEFKNNISNLFFNLGKNLLKKSFSDAESAFIAAKNWNPDNFEAEKALNEIREQIRTMEKKSETLVMNFIDSGF